MPSVMGLVAAGVAGFFLAASASASVVGFVPASVAVSVVGSTAVSASASMVGFVPASASASLVGSTAASASASVVGSTAGSASASASMVGFVPASVAVSVVGSTAASVAVSMVGFVPASASASVVGSTAGSFGGYAAISIAAAMLGWLLVVGGAGAALVFVLAWWRERRYLAGVLARVVPGGRVRDAKDLVALQRFLRASIRFDMDHAHDPRPLLRQRARATLERGEGFCGENARVAVRLLRLGGVRAHRLYLFGARWGHVVVEHAWDGAWRLFDANDDPATLPPEDALGRIDASRLDAFPNAVAENPWESAAVAKGLRRVPALARIKPPAPVVVLAESPDLVWASVAMMIAMVGGVILMVG